MSEKTFRVRLLIEGDDFPSVPMTEAELNDMPEGSFEIVGSD